MHSAGESCLCLVLTLDSYEKQLGETQESPCFYERAVLAASISWSTKIQEQLA